MNLKAVGQKFDAIVTDPPYYDAIPYADLMDFFYVWLRRTLHGLSPELRSSVYRVFVSEVERGTARRRAD